MSRSGEELLEALTTASPVKLQWDLTAEELTKLTEVAVARVREAYAKIAASKGNATYENTIQAMIDVDTWSYALTNVCTFPAHVSADKVIRDASTESEKAFDDLNVECSMNHEVYQAVSAYAASSEAAALEGEPKRLVDRLMRDFKRDGLHLDEEKRNKVKALKEEMNKLGTDFAKNLGEESAKFELSEAELQGCPADFMEPRKKEGADGTYNVNLKYPGACMATSHLPPLPFLSHCLPFCVPDYIPIMKYCTVAATRQKMEKEFNSRCKTENAPILEKLVSLRQEQADVLGYKTHAEYVLETRMARTPEKVLPFLADLAQKLTAVQEKEVATCLEIKKELEAASFDGKLNAWDTAFYKNKVEERDYQVDQQEIKQ
jgi:Zn-dependent oligopeptidase